MTILNNIADFLYNYWFIILLFYTIENIICSWFVFRKANKAGWITFIPIYRELIYFDISGLGKGYVIYYILAYLCRYIPVYGPIISTIFLFILTSIFWGDIATNFNRSLYFGSGLFLLNIVFLPILAFSPRSIYGLNSTSVVGIGNNVTLKKEAINSDGKKICPNCGYINSSSSIKCGRCGIFFK